MLLGKACTLSQSIQEPHREGFIFTASQMRKQKVPEVRQLVLGDTAGRKPVLLLWYLLRAGPEGLPHRHRGGSRRLGALGNRRKEGLTLRTGWRKGRPCPSPQAQTMQVPVQRPGHWHSQSH